MKVLALTHAHLNKQGLSPVSCERTDSITGSWGKKLNWDVDVIHTEHTKWPGIWPNGNRLKINIIKVVPSENLMITGVQPMFSKSLKALVDKKKFASIFSLIARRVGKRLRHSLAGKGFLLPSDMIKGQKWGKHILTIKDIHKKKYDFIFVSVGHGDEYLLETALVISNGLNVPMIVDFRDLWSDHHDPKRFNEQQKKLIRKYELRLLHKTILVSVPQKVEVSFLKKWVKMPVYQLSHSAYIEKDWEEGKIISDEFRMLYSGKLYAAAPGLDMFLQLIKELSAAPLYKQIRCYFFVDDPETLKKKVQQYEISDNVVINGWVSPSELWAHTRSAHLLVIPDPGISEDHPLFPTKTFQYAYSGRQILCLFRYKNEEMDELLKNYDAGKSFTNIADAKKWVEKLSFETSQYEALPSLRKIPLREDIAVEYALFIEQLLLKK